MKKKQIIENLNSIIEDCKVELKERRKIIEKQKIEIYNLIHKIRIYET